MSNSGNLGINLRFLCAEKSSIANVCREIGINQQQFSKYLSGRAMPSAHNLRRIAKYFDLNESLLMDEHQRLVDAYNKQERKFTNSERYLFTETFPGDLSKLRRYLGAYQVFFRAPVDPGGIVVNAMFLDEHNGLVTSRLIEVIRDESSTSGRWTRCDGMASYQSGRLFVVDSERHSEKALSMYILTPPPRQKGKYLFGTMCFLASLPTRKPHASRVALRRYDNFKSARELLGTCGIYSGKSRKLDPGIRNYLFPESEPNQI
ncbi:MAG: helix-turn-helix transcriptional regulator [Pseudomonadota bacterium]